MKMHSLWASLRVFGWLLWFDVRFLAKDFWDNLLDSIMWPVACIGMNGYVMPAVGVPANYGAFVTASMLVMMGSYTAWSAAAMITADLAGEQTITYELTLPLPYWMVWIKKGLYLSIKASVFNISSLIIGKVILGNGFDLSNFSVTKFFIIYIFSALFFGIFALWSTVVTKDVESHSRLDLRLVGPLFFVNGFLASWATMNSVSIFLGMLTLCTPWIYAYEGVRGAILGQTGYLSFWSCVLMLVVFIAFFAFMAIRLFKRRMDCV